MKATVTSKGQITIPAPLRSKFRLLPGTVLEFDERAPVLTARRAVSRARMDRAAGLLTEAMAGRTTAEWLEALRGEPPPAQRPPRRRR